MQQPTAKACRFLLSIPGCLRPVSTGPSLPVFLESSGTCLNSKTVSSPNPPLFSMMIAQKIFRTSYQYPLAKDRFPDEVQTYLDLPPVQVWNRSIKVAHCHEEQTLARRQSPIIKTGLTKPESVAKVITVQPTAVSFKEGPGSVARWLGHETLNHVVG